MKQLHSSAKIFLVALIVLAYFLPSCKNKREQHLQISDFNLLDRNTSLAYSTEWPLVQQKHKTLKENLKRNPADIKSTIVLISIYISEARITGNYDYYNIAAMSGINSILSKKPDHFEALTFKATILLSEHQFASALEIAEKIKKLYPYNAYVYGIITDAQVELGNYDLAVDAAEKMISLRPDIRSYSRIAYIREIHGDIPGAIEAMKLAVDAGAPGDENTEWCRTQMGKLYELTGNTKEATEIYNTVLLNRTLFPPALNGLASVAKNEKKYEEALKLYQQSDSIVSDHTSMEGIAEIFELTGKTKDALDTRNKILAKMKIFSGDGSVSKATGQNEDHEMAHAYIGVNNLDMAFKYAITEYKRRPGNIDVNETVATVLAKKGQFEEAMPYLENAMRTHSKKPELLALAGEIYSNTGRKPDAEIIQKEIGQLK